MSETERFVAPHDHCWHYTPTPTSAAQEPMHCCYCNEPYRVVVQTAVTTQHHGPWA